MKTAIAILCAIGFYVSLFMLRKSLLAERGEVDGPSVVKEPEARLFFGLPNALFGAIYFPLLAFAVWIYPAFAAPAGNAAIAIALRCIVLLAVALAAATSCVLAYSLLFVTKRECPYCWTGHATNALLLLLVPWTLW